MEGARIEPQEPGGPTPGEQKETPSQPQEQAPQFEQAPEVSREGVVREQPSQPSVAPGAPVTPIPTTDDHQRLLALAKKEQLDELTRIAFNEGIAKAVALAKKLENPYLLDEFHDSLVDDLKEHLLSEGKLEKL